MRAPGQQDVPPAEPPQPAQTAAPAAPPRWETLVTRPRFPLALTASAAALALALCSCASSGEPPAGSDGGARMDGGTQRMTLSATNPRPRTSLKRGGTLQWAVDRLPTQWNPLHVDGAEPATTAVMKALLPSFWHSDAGGTQTPNKAFLLDAASGTENARQTVTWTLNPKAHWSDGTPVTWRDLAATWRALNGTDPAYRTATAAGFDRVESVTRGKDDFQAVMVFRTRFSEWQSMFNNAADTPLLPAAHAGTPEQFNTGWADRIPATAGPFRPAGIDRTTGTVTLEADPGWWGEKPLLDRIVFRAMDPGAMADAFARGSVDYFDIGPDATAYHRAAEVGTGEIRKAGGSNVRALVLNGRSPQLTDPAVRRAVLRAIDRESIARTGLKGLDWAYTPMNNHFLVPGQNGYRDNSAGLSQYDVDTADAELDKAGWDRPGFGMRSKDGKPLTLRLVVPQTGQVAAAESTQVLEMLALAGIQVTVQKVPNADFLATYVNRHDFDLTLLDITGTPFPATSLASTFQQGAGGNVSQVGSQALDEALAEAASGETAKEGYEAINRADEQAWQVAGLIPLYQRPAIYAVRRAVANLGAPGMSDPVYEDIGFQK